MEPKLELVCPNLYEQSGIYLQENIQKSLQAEETLKSKYLGLTITENTNISTAFAAPVWK